MKVLITIRHSFPFGTPYAVRVNSFISILKQLDYDVVVLCENISKEINVLNDNYIVYENSKVYCLDHSYKKVNKILKMPRDYATKMEHIINMENPDLIITSSLYDRFIFIKKNAKKYNLPIILESCEWYDPSTFKHGKFSHHFILFSFCWNKLFPKVNGVIAISRLLESHYKEKCKNVIRIPTILNTDMVVPLLNLTIKSKIRLLFAGALARTKDSIKPFFEAFDLIGELSERFEVCVCGVEIKELKLHLGEKLFYRYKNLIICKGRIPQQSIADEYRNSHFGIFMRPLQRSSNAGFSTKLGEGMSLGTPFIINDTSDISLYIKNGINGFIVDSDANKIANIYSTILGMSNQEYNNLRFEARKTAEKEFNCVNYKHDVFELIKEVMKSN